MKPHKVRLWPEAYTDLQQARSWYRQHNKNLPKRFTHELNNVLEQVSLMPETHAIRYRDVRVAKLRVFPYAVHYFIESRTTAIVVIAILHTAISPEQQRKRIEKAYRPG